MEMRRFDFKDRDRRVVELILDKSFRLARFFAWFPKLEYIGVLTGISKGNVSGIMDRLKRNLVISVSERCFYGLNPFPDKWRIPLRYELTEEIRRLDAALDFPAEQLRFPEDPDLQDALLQVALEEFALGRTVRQSKTETHLPTLSAGIIAGADCLRADQRDAAGLGNNRESGCALMREGNTVAGGRSQLPSANFQVPKMGTGFPKWEPRETGVSSNIDGPFVPVVPKMGTSHLTVKKFQLLNAPERAVNNEPFNGVPEVGTEVENWRRRKADPELLEQLKAIMGDKEWANWGGYWTNQVKKDSDLIRRVLGEFRYATKTGAVIHNPGGWMKDLIRRWS